MAGHPLRRDKTTSARSVPSVLRDASDRPVLVGGCPRSGTTLLAMMLHAHPMLAMPPETRFVMETFDQRSRFGDLSRAEARREVGDWIATTRGTRIKRLGLPRERVVEAVVAAPATIGSLSGAVLAEFAAEHGKSRWGDKRPKHVQRLPQLLALFPDAQFVHVIRDPRGSVASMKRLGWWGGGVAEATQRWRRAIESGIKARDRYRADQYLEVRYEDLVADPASELARVCDFLAVDFSAAMLQQQENAYLVPQAYHERVARPVDTAARDAWRGQLTPDDVGLVQHLVGDLMPAVGYDLDEHGAAPVPAADRARHAVRRLRSSARDTAMRGRQAVAAAAYRQPVAARLTTGQRRLANL